MQAFALSQYLQQKSYDVVFLNRYSNSSKIKAVLKKIRYKYSFLDKKAHRYKSMKTFIDKKLTVTLPLFSDLEMERYVINNQLCAVIVGSDQVWRREFVIGSGLNYFLDFLPENCKRIAYAASFGINQWNYNNSETALIKSSLLSFKGISLREDEAVQMCKEYLGIETTRLIDPTLLIDAEVYKHLAVPNQSANKYIFVYWLGEKSKVDEYINKNSLREQYTIIDISLREHSLEQPSIEEWLSYILYAECIITDSFHGCVFSLLFHKHFILFPNDIGGNDRILSLLRTFDIQDKLYNPQFDINYDKFEKKLMVERQKSEHFLQKSLNS